MAASRGVRETSDVSDNREKRASCREECGPSVVRAYRTADPTRGLLPATVLDAALSVDGCRLGRARA